MTAQIIHLRRDASAEREDAELLAEARAVNDPRCCSYQLDALVLLALIGVLALVAVLGWAAWQAWRLLAMVLL